MAISRARFLYGLVSVDIVLDAVIEDTVTQIRYEMAQTLQSAQDYTDTQVALSSNGSPTSDGPTPSGIDAGTF